MTSQTQEQEDVAREVMSDLQENAKVIGRNALRTELLLEVKRLRDEGFPLDTILGLVVLNLAKREAPPRQWFK